MYTAEALAANADEVWIDNKQDGHLGGLGNFSAAFSSLISILAYAARIS